ncbi:ATP-binding protein [Cohnella sp. GCM10027633]|uniref:HAMP domain-containing sensor histidine kinase n=1 Tax=unclassified Cohnella TaxID=2636738 RepID=UPI00362DE964
MKARWIAVLVAAIFLSGLLLSVRTIGTKGEPQVDIVLVNELAKTAEINWDRLDRTDFADIRQPFAIIDNMGNVRFETSPEAFGNLNDAIRNRSAIADVTIDGRIVGKVVLPSDDEHAYGQDKRRLAMTIFVAFTLLAILCAIYAYYLHRTVFRPFKQLRSFAANIARGNLDIPLRASANNPFGAFTESFDLMREQLASARRSEYEANRSKKELVASLSHDIKTPVSSIKAVSELMLVKATDEKTIKQLNLIGSKADQINLLITDMFHATLEEMQQLKVAVTEELSSAVADIVSNVDYYDKISRGPIPPCLILADIARLQQVFDNIVSNADKYADTPITIESRIADGYLEISVMDFGPGVDEDEMPLLFNKFYRGHNAEGRSGTGLGLYISRYLLRSMGGDIACRNRVDGFTVTVKLKIA